MIHVSETLGELGQSDSIASERELKSVLGCQIISNCFHRASTGAHSNTNQHALAPDCRTSL